MVSRGRWPWTPLLLLAASRLLTPARACDGHYCGTYYCGGGLAWDDAREGCAFGRAPVGCTDACCRTHDACCYNASRGDCNARMVACLDACDAAEAVCLYGAVPVAQPLVRAAMRLVEGWCCNGPC